MGPARGRRRVLFQHDECGQLHLCVGDSDESTETPVETPRAYPTSARKQTNWDAVAKAAALEDDAPMDSKDPNAGGDKALNKLFQTLYADATDEQKKAMIKSYQESNGTALSTDWNEVKKASLFDVPDPLLTLRAGNGRDQAARGMAIPLSTCGIGS